MKNNTNDIPITWVAAVQSSSKVKEKNRTTEEYMRLPASEYSVLSGINIVIILLSTSFHHHVIMSSSLLSLSFY